MNYPNTLNGLRKIRLSVILEMVMSVIMLIITVLSLLLLNEPPETIVTQHLALSSFVFFLTAADAVLAIIALVMRLVGTNSAGKEAAPFRTAFIILICSLAGSVAANLLPLPETVKDILSYAVRCLSLASMIYIFSGIRVIAESMDKHAFADKGKRLLQLILILFAISFIGDIILSKLLHTLPPMLEVVLSVAVTAFSLTVSILYYRHLTETVSLLETDQNAQIPAEEN